MTLAGLPMTLRMRRSHSIYKPGRSGPARSACCGAGRGVRRPTRACGCCGSRGPVTYLAEERRLERRSTSTTGKREGERARPRILPRAAGEAGVGGVDRPWAWAPTVRPATPLRLPNEPAGRWVKRSMTAARRAT